MRRLSLAFIVALMFSSTAMAIDIAISTQAGWWAQDLANVEMQEIADNVTSATVQQFTADDHAALADWVAAHTGDGVPDLLILCGVFPDSIYPGGNAQPDDSLAELFLDDGNTIINTGDWIFYVNSAGSNNAEGGLQNMMDLPGIAMWGDGTPCVVTSEGMGLTPSLQDVPSTRPFFVDQVTGDWSPELILGQTDDGTAVDPAIMVNAVTGGRVGIFIQAADTLTDIRGEVLSEWINNWYLPTLGNPALPGSPVPSNYSADVLRDVVLSWVPGQGATAHDVYVGVDETAVATADKDNPMDVLVSQDQVETTLDMGVLDFGTTYYWRVDEVNGADGSIVMGPVWSFTTERLAYPVVGVTATSNAVSEEGVTPENLVNGSGLTDGLHSGDTVDMWLATPDANDPTWIEFDLGHVVSLYEMLVWNHNSGFEMALGFGVKDTMVEYSVDGMNWTTLGDVTLAQAPGLAGYPANTAIAFDGAAAQYVRLTILNTYMPSGKVGLSEVQFSSIPVFATEPSPESGADEVATDVVLSWLAGRDAVAHEIYLSNDEVAVTDGIALVDVVTDASFDTSDLDLSKGTTYYWKVNEMTAGEVVFSEDFEAYETHSVLQDKGGWKGWDNTPGASAPASDTVANSGINAVEIRGTTDLVREFDVAGGQHEFSAMQYIPSGTTGITYFLLLNTYSDGGPYNWSIQIPFDLDNGILTSDMGGGATASIVYDQWVEVKCVIDLDNNTVDEYYNGQLLATHAWQTDGVNAIASIDLFGNSASSIYYDDITIQSLASAVWEGDVWTFRTEGQFLGLVDVTSPGDVVVGVPNDGDWPDAEPPAGAIDDDITTKFLHFQGGNMPTGIQVTPSVGPSIVTGLGFTTANDAAGRDPIAYEVYGSNDSIDGPYTLIAAGDIVDFAGEQEWPRFKGNNTDILFENTVMYDHYQVILTAVRDADQNLMQIAEIELLGARPTDVTGPADAVVGIPNDGDWPDAETPDLAVDDDVNTKFLHFQGGNMTTGIQITVPAPSMVTGLSFTTANDAAGRDPIAYELYASADGAEGTYELIASGDIVDFAGEVEWPRFTPNATPIVIANRAKFRYYQVVFPAVRDAGQNLMQIAEVELLGFADEALDVTAVGDAVLGVPNDGDWPAAEYPDLAVDDDVTTKFLHFQGGNMATGIQVTPVGPSRIIGLALTSANDAAGRDPASFEIYGSNESIEGPYELIAAGDVADFIQEAEWPRFTKNETPISFANEMVYTHYQIIFPTVRDPSQSLMQIAEIGLLGFFE